MAHAPLRFNGFTLDLDRQQLRGSGGEIALRRKTFDVLRYLLHNPDRVVSKAELVEAVWGGTAVGDESLAQCISELRHALDDEQRRLIKTVPRRGYLIELNALGAAKAPLASEAQSLTNRPSIAVLAFENLNNDPKQEYFSDGISEEIITQLAKLPELLVIARNSSFRFKNQRVDIQQVGRELGVRYVLEGSVRRVRNRVRVTAQLIDATEGTHRWGERYDRNLKDIFDIQAELADTIAAMLAVQIRKAEAERSLSKPTGSLQAYDFYLRATHILRSSHHFSRKEDLHNGRRLLERAIALDADYAGAITALSVTYVLSWLRRWDDDRPWPEALDRAHELANRSVSLAPDLADAHCALGWALLWKRQHDAALAILERVSKLNRNAANWRYPWALLLAGEPRLAEEELEAYRRLDPFYGLHLPLVAGLSNYMLGEYDKALVHLQEHVSRAPGVLSGHVWLAAVHAQLGDVEAARSSTIAARRIEPSWTPNYSPILASLKRPEDYRHFLDGLSKAAEAANTQ